MQKPILDSIAFSEDNGIIAIILIVIIISIIYYIIKRFINKVINQKVNEALKQERETQIALKTAKLVHQRAIENFFNNRIEEDIENMPLKKYSSKAKKLINLYTAQEEEINL